MTGKTWRFLAIAYLALYGVAIAFEIHHHRDRLSMSPMMMILTAPIAWGFAFHGVQNDYVRGRFSRVERWDSPLTFWINIAFYLGFGLVLFYCGVRDAFL
jgi:hypothetical protein